MFHPIDRFGPFNPNDEPELLPVLPLPNHSANSDWDQIDLIDIDDVGMDSHITSQYPPSGMNQSVHRSMKPNDQDWRQNERFGNGDEEDYHASRLEWFSLPHPCQNDQSLNQHVDPYCNHPNEAVYNGYPSAMVQNKPTHAQSQPHQHPHLNFIPETFSERVRDGPSARASNGPSARTSPVEDYKTIATEQRGCAVQNPNPHQQLGHQNQNWSQTFDKFQSIPSLQNIQLQLSPFTNLSNLGSINSIGGNGGHGSQLGLGMSSGGFSVDTTSNSTATSNNHQQPPSPH